MYHILMVNTIDGSRYTLALSIVEMINIFRVSMHVNVGQQIYLGVLLLICIGRVSSILCEV